MDSITDYDVLGLFINNLDGKPLSFCMGPCGTERQLAKQLVEEGGGILFDRIPNLHYRDNCIKLVAKGEIPLKRDQDMFDHKYVVDCARAGQILPNLLDYRVNTQSQFLDYDPLDILLGYKKWSTLPKKEEGEKVSDIEFLEEHDVARADREFKMFKSGRYSYSKKEQLEMLNFIFKRRAYKLLKGNVIWQRMEDNNVCGGRRTWQSMKEHFRKQVMSRIHQFGITERQIRKLRACYDLDVLHPSDESSDGDEESPAELKRRLRPVVSSNDRPVSPAENRPESDVENRPGPSLRSRISPSVVHVEALESRLGPSKDGPYTSPTKKKPPSAVVNPCHFTTSPSSKSKGKGDKNVSFDDDESTKTKDKFIAGPHITYKKSSLAKPKRWLGKAKSRDISEIDGEPVEVLAVTGKETTSEGTDKSELFKTAEELSKSTEDKVDDTNLESVPTNNQHGFDNEVIEENPEELLDQSQVPAHQRSMRLSPPLKRKRRLYSVDKCFLNSPVDPNESVDMFDDTPPRGRKTRRNEGHKLSGIEPTISEEVVLPGSSQEFGLGLKQVSGESAGSVVEVDGAVTSTQNINNASPLAQDGQVLDGDPEIVEGVDEAEDEESNVDGEEGDKGGEDAEGIGQSRQVTGNSSDIENIFSQSKDTNDPEGNARSDEDNPVENDIVQRKNPVIALDGDLSQDELRLVIESSAEPTDSPVEVPVEDGTRDNLDASGNNDSIDLLAIADDSEVPQINNLLALNTQELERLSPTADELFASAGKIIDSQSEEVNNEVIVRNDTYTLSQPTVEGVPVIDSLNTSKADSDKAGVDNSNGTNEEDEGMVEGKHKRTDKGLKGKEQVGGYNEKGTEKRKKNQDTGCQNTEIEAERNNVCEELVEGDGLGTENISVLEDSMEIIGEDNVYKNVEEDGEEGQGLKGFSPSGNLRDNLPVSKVPSVENLSDGDSIVEPSDDDEKVNSKVSSIRKTVDANVPTATSRTGTENVQPPSKAPKNKKRPPPDNSKRSKSGPYFDSLSKRDGKGGSTGRKEVPKHKEHLVVVAGLPSDIDSQDIELVRPGNVHVGINATPKLPRARRKESKLSTGKRSKGGLGKDKRTRMSNEGANKNDGGRQTVTDLNTSTESDDTELTPEEVLDKRKRKENETARASYRNYKMAMEMMRTKSPRTACCSGKFSTFDGKAGGEHLCSRRTSRHESRPHSPDQSYDASKDTDDGDKGEKQKRTRRRLSKDLDNPPEKVNESSLESQTESESDQRKDSESEVIEHSSLESSISPRSRSKRVSAKSGQTVRSNDSIAGSDGPTAVPIAPTARSRGPTVVPIDPTARSSGPTAGTSGSTARPRGPSAGPRGPTAGPSGPTAGPSGIGRKKKDALTLDHHEANPDVAAAKKPKLKIVAVGKENNADASMIYQKKFRTPYSHLEDRALINYFLENRGFSRRKGTTVWKLMEKMLVVPGRTWQSMKGRWEKIETTNILVRHGVTKQDLLDADEDTDGDGDDGAANTTTDTNASSVSSSSRNPYTVNEDLKIVKFIVETKRYNETGGNSLWKTMEERKVVPNRSWHSLKERFRKVIMGNIDQFEMAEDIRAAFKNIGGKKTEKQKRMKK